jgi:hypothetical protein
LVEGDEEDVHGVTALLASEETMGEMIPTTKVTRT